MSLRKSGDVGIKPQDLPAQIEAAKEKVLQREEKAEEKEEKQERNFLYPWEMVHSPDNSAGVKPSELGDQIEQTKQPALNS